MHLHIFGRYCVPKPSNPITRTNPPSNSWRLYHVGSRFPGEQWNPPLCRAQVSLNHFPTSLTYQFLLEWRTSVLEHVMMVAGLSPFPEKKTGWHYIFWFGIPIQHHYWERGTTQVIWYLYMEFPSIVHLPSMFNVDVSPRQILDILPAESFKQTAPRSRWFIRGLLLADPIIPSRYLYRRYHLRSQTRKRPNPSKKPLDDWKITCCFNMF